MKYINYKYSKDINSLNKIIFKSCHKLDIQTLINKTIKVKDYKENIVIKRISAVEVMKLCEYTSILDNMCTNGFYTNSESKVNIQLLKKDLNIKDNKVIILTVY